MSVFFWIFAVLGVGSAALAITRKNAVASALWIALAFVCVAAEFVLLRAYFLAAVQVLVYAGAIMVLFLFVIMLLNLSEKDQEILDRGPKFHVIGLGLAGLFFAAFVLTIRKAGLFDVKVGASGAVGETAQVASPLFLEYLLPFEIASFLLLAAIVGAVLITKRRLR